jgi:hypothetical protein
MTGLEHALIALEQAVDAPRRHHVWRWLVRQRMTGVKEALSDELARGGDAAMASREIHLQKERRLLLRRLADLGPRVLEAPDIEAVRSDLHRLLADIDRHRQRLNDLVYDSVSMELGGSE